jgi:hypothetical protein
MRQADANVKAWIQVGIANYRLNTCNRLGNTDGLISISMIDEVNADYRRRIGSLYEEYVATYLKLFRPNRVNLRIWPRLVRIYCSMTSFHM